MRRTSIICVNAFITWTLTVGLAWSQAVPTTLPSSEELKALNLEGLRALGPDHPKLKQAYAALFLKRYGESTPWQRVVFDDLLRRGDKAIPTLLALFEENPEGSFREELLFGLFMYPSLEVSLVRARVRKLVDEEGTKMTSRTNAAVCDFLGRFGTAEDLAILEKIAARDPDPQSLTRRHALGYHKLLKERLEELPSTDSQNRKPSGDLNKTPDSSPGQVGTLRPVTQSPAQSASPSKEFW